MIKKQKEGTTLKSTTKKTNWLLRIIFVIALGVFLYSGYQLYHLYDLAKQEANDKSKIQEIAKISDDVDYDHLTIDWSNLQEQNSDIIGWIIIPDTDINYPIVHGTDNNFYLTHNFLKEEHYAGAIFLDTPANTDFSNHNSFIYGHNVKHGTMFAELEKFKEPTFFEEHPIIYLYTPDKNYHGEVITMYSTLATSDTYLMNTSTEEGFQNYISMFQQVPGNHSSIAVSAADQIITLSTCSYEQGGEISDARYVLHALLVEVK